MYPNLYKNNKNLIKEEWFIRCKNKIILSIRNIFKYETKRGRLVW